MFPGHSNFPRRVSGAQKNLTVMVEGRGVAKVIARELRRETKSLGPQWQDGVTLIV